MLPPGGTIMTLFHNVQMWFRCFQQKRVLSVQCGNTQILRLRGSVSSHAFGPRFRIQFATSTASSLSPVRKFRTAMPSSICHLNHRHCPVKKSNLMRFHTELRGVILGVLSNAASTSSKITSWWQYYHAGDSEVCHVTVSYFLVWTWLSRFDSWHIRAVYSSSGLDFCTADTQKIVYRSKHQNISLSLQSHEPEGTPEICLSRGELLFQSPYK